MARLRLPPKNAYPHKISYYYPTGEEDVWGKPEFSDPVELEHVRVDEGYDFKRNGVNSSDDMPNSLVSILKKYNPNMPEFVNQGIVEYKGKEFTIIGNIPLYFMSDEVIGYELEVK